MGNAVREYGQLFFSACEQLFREPLFKHMQQGGVNVLLWSDDDRALLEYLTVVVSCGCMPETPLRVQVCCQEPERLRQRLLEECPMFSRMFSRADTAEITLCSEPEAFPEYVLCAPEYEKRVPEDRFCAVMQYQPVSEELLRLAGNLHYTFSISYGSRESLDTILEKMQKSNYNFASSVLQAAHLPVKLFCAGVESAQVETAAREYMLRTQRDVGIVNRLVYLEHRRWSVFMALSGWNLPTCEQIAQYAFVERDGGMIAEFQHRSELLHPSLAECSIEGVDALENRGAEYWDRYDPALPEYAGLDELSRMSLWQHRYVMERAAEHCAEVGRLLAKIKRKSPRMPGLDRLVKSVNRAANQAPGAEAELRMTLKQMEGSLESAMLDRIELLMKSSIEAGRRRSYLQGDIFSTRTIGFVLLFRRRFTRIVRMLSATPEDNIHALMQLDPEKAAFIAEPGAMPKIVEEERRGGVLTFADTRRLRTQLHFIEASGSMSAAVQEALNYVGEGAVVDVTGASPYFIHAVMNRECCIVQNGHLAPFIGCDSIGVMNALPRTLLVEDVFAAMNRRTYEGWEIPDHTGMEKIIDRAFDAYLELTDADGSIYTQLTAYLHKLSNTIGGDWTKKGRPFDFALRKSIAVERNVMGCLKSLECDGFVQQLRFDADTEGNYRYAGVSHISNLIEVLSNQEARNYACSIKVVSGNKRGQLALMRVVQDSFPNPTSEALFGALQRFASAGCFNRTNEGWQYASPAAMGIFSKNGNILEDYLYHAVRMNPHYRDVQLGYSFGSLSLGYEKMEHEIDVVAVTADNRPVLFSCKLGYGSLEESAVDEIYRHSRLYSLNRPVPVLVTACPEELLAKKGFEEGGRAYKYMQSLGVRLIGRDTLSDPKKLQQTLNEIASA